MAYGVNTYDDGIGYGAAVAHSPATERAAFVQRTYGHLAPHFRLIQGDACKQDYAALMGAEPYRCVANLPYSCSSPFLATMGSLANPPQDMHVLLQKEMADRLTAAAHSKDYGVLTVRLALRYDMTLVRTVPPAVFFPGAASWSSIRACWAWG